jgi:nucleotide-binding universal stress UspA family protein
MYRRILVGYDGTEGGRDALALAETLRAPDGAVIAACVHPSKAHARDERVETLFADAAAQVVAAARAQVRDDWLEFRTVAGHSPAHGLHVLSEELGADLAVVGSSKGTTSGQTRPGSTGERLLNGSPCAVAVAPAGFAADAGEPRVIGVAYDDSDESRAALREAGELARQFEATVRVITAVPPLQQYWSGESFAGAVASGEAIREARHESFRQMQVKAAETLPPEARVATDLVAGRPADVIAAEAEKGIHVLLMGSRSYGPIRRVMVGSTAIETMRRAPCPVIVIPRGAAGSGAEPVAAEAVTTA